MSPVMARSGGKRCPLECRLLGDKRTRSTQSELFAFWTRADIAENREFGPAYRGSWPSPCHSPVLKSLSGPDSCAGDWKDPLSTGRDLVRSIPQGAFARAAQM